MDIPASEQVIQWLARAEDLSNSSSFRVLNKELVKTQEDFGEFSQYDRSKKIIEKSDLLIREISDLSMEMRNSSLTDPSMHYLKDKFSKFLKVHSQTLATVNGLKQKKVEETINKFHELWYTVYN